MVVEKLHELLRSLDIWVSNNKLRYTPVTFLSFTLEFHSMKRITQSKLNALTNEKCQLVSVIFDCNLYGDPWILRNLGKHNAVLINPP